MNNDFSAWMVQRFGPELSGVSPVVHEQLLEAWQAATAAERSRCVAIAQEEAADQESYSGSDAAGVAHSIAAAILAQKYADDGLVQTSAKEKP